MGQKYNAVLVSKTTARELVREVINNLNDDDIEKLSEKDLLDKASKVVYNRLRRQANVDKLASV